MGLVGACHATTICNQILPHVHTVLLGRGSSARQARGRIAVWSSFLCGVTIVSSVGLQSLVCTGWCLVPISCPTWSCPLQPVFRLHGLNLTSLINARQDVLSCASSNHLLRQTLVSSVVELSAGNPSFILVSGDTVAAALFSSPPLPRLCIIACPHVRCCAPCEEDWWGVT